MDTTSKDTSWLAEDLRIGKLLLAGELKECKHHLSALTTGSDFDSHTSTSLRFAASRFDPMCFATSTRFNSFRLAAHRFDPMRFECIPFAALRCSSIRCNALRYFSSPQFPVLRCPSMRSDALMHSLCFFWFPPLQLASLRFYSLRCVDHCLIGLLSRKLSQSQIAAS